MIRSQMGIYAGTCTTQQDGTVQGRSALVEALMEDTLTKLDLLHTHRFFKDREGLIQRADTLPKPRSIVPFPRDPDFTERGDLLDRIKTGLSTPAARLALVGLGGVG